MIIKSFPQSVGDGHTKLIRQRRRAAGGLNRLFKPPGQKMAHEQSADARKKGTSTKHIYTHRYSPQNIKGAEKQQIRDVFFAKVRCSRTKIV